MDTNCLIALSISCYVCIKGFFLIYGDPRGVVKLLNWEVSEQLKRQAWHPIYIQTYIYIQTTTVVIMNEIVLNARELLLSFLSLFSHYIRKFHFKIHNNTLHDKLVRHILTDW